ncbi:MAG TPA: regulatory protein RecX [Candidatus Binatia bacterium]|nr:regulatory protein RecX [Candidatus Binatia bacterium]
MKSLQSAIRDRQSSLTPLDYAYRLLARRAYSEQELTDKLLAKGFTAAAGARTVARLKTQGYLDDARLAADQAERLRARGFGAEGIKAKLAQKGLPPETVAQTLETGGENQELESARHLLASRFSADALKQSHIHARAYRLLLRRGYSQEVVESLLGSTAEDL